VTLGRDEGGGAKTASGKSNGSLEFCSFDCLNNYIKEIVREKVASSRLP